MARSTAPNWVVALTNLSPPTYFFVVSSKVTKSGFRVEDSLHSASRRAGPKPHES